MPLLRSNQSGFSLIGALIAAGIFAAALANFLVGYNQISSFGKSINHMSEISSLESKLIDHFATRMVFGTNVNICPRTNAVENEKFQAYILMDLLDIKYQGLEFHTPDGTLIKQRDWNAEMSERYNDKLAIVDTITQTFTRPARPGFACARGVTLNDMGLTTCFQIVSKNGPSVLNINAYINVEYMDLGTGARLDCRTKRITPNQGLDMYYRLEWNDPSGRPQQRLGRKVLGYSDD